MCILSVCFTCMYLCVPHAFLVNVEVRRGSQTLGPGVKFLILAEYGCWELDLSYLEVHPFHITTEPSLQTFAGIFLGVITAHLQHKHS